LHSHLISVEDIFSAAHTQNPQNADIYGYLFAELKNELLIFSTF